ncbi:extracellular matrix protein 3-like [Dysidea avara]|uniref:extracellular matrix protein 3-like n=1 Tax=Dysidea avara TaxID=196820 RepID=UPI00332E335A
MLLASFGPNDITSVVNVSITDDNIVEDQEMFQLLLIVPSPAENVGITAGSPHVANAVILDNDVMHIRFDQPLHKITEGDVAKVEIVSDHVAEVNISIIIQITSLTASVENYYYNGTIVSTLISGYKNISISIATVDDNIVELNEVLEVRIVDIIAVPGVSVLILEPNTTSIEITNNDETLVSLLSDQYSTSEGDLLVLTVVLDKILSFSETVYIRAITSNTSTSATADDYSSSIVAVNISPGVWNTTVSLAITDDDLLEPTEYFNVSLMLPSLLLNKSISLGNISTAIVTVTDNDVTFVSLSTNAYFVHENDYQVTILMTSSSISSTRFVVELNIREGSATASDFAATNIIPIKFEANVTVVAVNITINLVSI